MPNNFRGQSINTLSTYLRRESGCGQVVVSHLRARFAEPALFDLSLTISAYEPAPRVMTGVEGTIRGPS